METKDLVTNDFRKTLILVITGLFVFTFIGNYYFRASFYDSSVSYAFIRSIVTVFIPFSSFPVLMWISKKFLLLEHWKNVVLHIVFSSIYVVAFTLVLQFILLLIAGYNMFEIPAEEVIFMFRRQLISTGSSSFLLYWGITILVGVGRYYIDVSLLIERTNSLESQLSKATLATLKAQLKPHFLFNTLNMVDFLIHTKPDKAIETVSKLEDLIKSTFDQNQPNACTIKEEVLFLEKYLDIEKARFSDRLSIRFDIDEDVEHIKIPCYLIQPLVENSIKHGVGKSLEECTISICSKYKGDFFVIEVSDNAKGFKNKPEKQNWSIGLRNIEERIKLYFGENAFLDLSSFEVDGFKSTILIPKKYIKL